MTLNPSPDMGNPFHKGDRIRKARELAGYKDISSFADMTGLDRGSLGKYEATGDVPRRSTIKTIAMATGVRSEWLETGTGPIFGGPSGSGPGNSQQQLRSDHSRRQVISLFPRQQLAHAS